MRRIRSYVLREGRFTKAQKKATDELFPIWGITLEEDKKLELNNIFGNDNDVIVEIGFGMGDSLVEQAKNMENTNFIGIEVYGPGIGSCLESINKEKLLNVRVIKDDATAAIKHFTEKSLRKIQIFFPDPWHKKKHYKRRLIQIPFIELISTRIKKDGLVHLATDWENYAVHMSKVLKQIKNIENIATNSAYIERPDDRPVTKFEMRGKKLGHKVWDLMYRKI